MINWKDNVVWVTGASSGIGLAVAVEMAAKGAKIVLSSRNQQKLEEVKQSLTNPDRHVILPLDVSDKDGLAKAIETNQELLSTVNALVNSAGISQRSLTWEASPESERHVFETNYFGSIATAKAVLPHMVANNDGLIINLSSIVGRIGFPLRSSYAASKHAIHGYFDSLRAELPGKNIQILNVCPGRIKTNISLNAVTSDGSKHGEMDPGQAGGIPADVCARKIIRAAESGAAELYIGKERFLIYLHRYLPSVFRRVVSKFNPT